jgi:invasion protein IalB
MVQLAMDSEGNSVVSAAMQVLPEGGSAQLGVVMISPLLTLLPRGISVAVDDGVPAAYPFSWCDPNGCYSRFGLTPAQVDAFKAGTTAKINIFAVTDAKNPVTATLSLSGFTDALADLSAR